MNIRNDPFIKSATLVTAVLGGSAVSAQDVGQVTVGAGVSTFGANLEAAYQIDPSFRVRGVLAGLPGLDILTDTFEEDGTTYTYDATVGAVALLADYYPVNSGWRVSGGVMFNQTSFDANGVLSAGNQFTLDDGTVFDTGSVDISAQFVQEISPMITTGYDYRFSNNWILSGEVGAIYTGGLTFEATSDNALLQAEIDSDSDIEQARDDLAEFKFYPYLAITVGYSF